MLAAFCTGDPALEAIARAEPARRGAPLHPDVVFAEIVHSPDGRLANISARPVLRDHEIAFLGRSGAARDRQIEIHRSPRVVRDNRVVLRSRPPRSRDRPRLTTAHNSARARSVHTRFLARVAVPGARDAGVRISPLDRLPRVRGSGPVASCCRGIVEPCRATTSRA